MNSASKPILVKLEPAVEATLSEDVSLKDDQFCAFIKQTLGTDLYSSVQMNGVGFDQEWAQKSVKLLCYQKRKVFFGNNLFARGACAAGVERLEKRALKGYPDIDKVLYEKDRGTHAIMGFKAIKLYEPPYLQVALDLDNEEAMARIIKQLPNRERILLEAGTPLVKKFGVGIVGKIRELAPSAFIIADLKTLDVGRVEVKMAADETADAVAISGLGTIESIEKAIHETQKQGIYSILDMMNVDNFTDKIKQLNPEFMPDIVLLHRNVDLESKLRAEGKNLDDVSAWGNIKEIKKITGGLVAVAGGVTPEKAPEAFEKGADIIIAGRYIIGSGDPRRAAEDFLAQMPVDPNHMRVVMEDDEQI
jgi:bifunctional enzyme Fae/Hps